LEDINFDDFLSLPSSLKANHDLDVFFPFPPPSAISVLETDPQPAFFQSTPPFSYQQFVLFFKEKGAFRPPPTGSFSRLLYPDVLSAVSAPEPLPFFFFSRLVAVL